MKTFDVNLFAATDTVNNFCKPVIAITCKNKIYNIKERRKRR